MATADRAPTISDKLKFEWPVMVTIIGGVLYLAMALSGINERLAAIETKLESLPSMQSQIAAQGERLSRLEALVAK